MTPEQIAVIPQIRNPRLNGDATIDCEINHPDHGWIPFTASPEDAHEAGRGIFEAARRMGPAQYVEPETALDDARGAARAAITTLAADTRARLAGTSDPAKLAEYVDKAVHARAVIDGAAGADIMAEAETEAQSLGLEDAAALARIWQQKAARLRGLRPQLNVLVRAGLSAIAGADTPGDVGKASQDAQDAISAWLDGLEAEGTDTGGEPDDTQA